MAALIDTLADDGITVVLDSPPLLPVTDAALLARATDGALVVTRAASTHVEQLAGACEALRIAGATVLGVVLNRVPRKTRLGLLRRVRRLPRLPQHHPGRGPRRAGARRAARANAVRDNAPRAGGERSRPRPHRPARGAADLRSASPPPRRPPNRRPDAVRAAWPPTHLRRPTAYQPANGHEPATGQPHHDLVPGLWTAAPPEARRDALRPVSDPRDDLVIDPDRATISRLDPVDSDPQMPSTWHIEWGDLPALIASPRSGEINGNGGDPANGARHRN